MQNVDSVAGYPIEVLIQRYQDELQRQQQQQGQAQEEQGQQPMSFSTTILPYLDQFEFTSRGGLSGRVYGVTGIADGTWIETSPLVHVETTLPKGFVMTQERILYEVGTPKMGAAAAAAAATAASTPTTSISSILFNNASLLSSINANSSSNKLVKEEGETQALLDADVLNLGALTAALIGGALAFESLSHHLTVNVFWI